MNWESCPSTVHFISIHASCTGRDGTTGNTTVTLRLKNITSSSYQSEEAEYYTHRSLTQHYIKQRKTYMLLDIARGLEQMTCPRCSYCCPRLLNGNPKLLIEVDLVVESTITWAIFFAVENINEARLSTEHTQQDLVWLLTTWWGSKALCGVCCGKQVWISKDSEQGIVYSEVCKRG